MSNLRLRLLKSLTQNGDSESNQCAYLLPQSSLNYFSVLAVFGHALLFGGIKGGCRYSEKNINLCTNILNLKLVGSMAPDPADAASWQSCEQTGLWGFASYYFILDVRVFLYQIVSQVTVQWRHSCSLNY